MKDSKVNRTIHEDEFNLSRFLKDIEAEYAPKASSKGLEFVVEVDNNLPAHYRGDTKRIRMILGVLIENGIKHTPEGLVYLRINGTAGDSTAKLEFRVSDTGTGIPDYKMDSVLKVGKDLPGICSILASMHTFLKYNSVYGIGSQFFFTLELIVVDTQTLADITGLDDNARNDIAKTNAAIDGLPQITGIKWIKAYELMPDKDMIIEVVKEFYTCASREIKILQDFYDGYFAAPNDNDLDNYRIKVHAMKNSAALIGAMDLSSEAKALEYASRDKDVNYVKNNHHKYKEDYLDLAGRLAEGFGESLDEISSRTIDREVLLESICALEVAMEDVDIATLNDVMEELELYEYDEKLGAQIAKLGESVLYLNKELFAEGITGIKSILETN